MSKLIWSRHWTPEDTAVPGDFISENYGETLKVPRTSAIAVATPDIQLPDPRAIRSMTRAAALLSSVCVSAKEVLEPFLKEDAFSVGIYCAVENGTVDYGTTQQMKNITDQEFAERYKKLRNPKMYLKQLPNLAAAQMGIFLNIMGPMNVYSHSTAAGIQALEQAEFDLENGLVKAALVCAGFSFEDPLLVARHSLDSAKGRILAEGAGALVLVPSGQKSAWDKPAADDAKFYYGVSQTIVSISKGRK